jgi:mutator protein MutT
MKTDKRAVGVIIKDGKLLVFRRFKNGEWYFSFPGGGVEEGESVEEAVVREMKEELSLDVVIDKLIFHQRINRRPSDENRDHYFYLITKFSGTPKLGGPEKKRTNKDNRYITKWINLADLSKYDKLYPTECKEKLIKMIKNEEV